MQMDAETAIVAPDWPTLDLYCDRVAAAVGRLSVRAFGDASADADQVAYALGRALQLTNILRDVDEDAERGRLYLPREWLTEAGVPCEPRGRPRAILDLAAFARAWPRSRTGISTDAHAAMRRCDRRAMRPARLMGATYAAVLAAWSGAAGTAFAAGEAAEMAETLDRGPIRARLMSQQIRPACCLGSGHLPSRKRMGAVGAPTPAAAATSRREGGAFSSA